MGSQFLAQLSRQFDANSMMRRQFSSPNTVWRMLGAGVLAPGVPTQKLLSIEVMRDRLRDDTLEDTLKHVAETHRQMRQYK